MNQPEVRQLETRAGPDALVEFEQVLSEAWSVHPHVPDPVRTQVGIATGEIGANIIEHAAQGRPVRIVMRVTVQPTEVWVEFTDDGYPLHVDLSAVHLPDEMAERGRGLALAKAVLARLAYERNASNHWTLVSKPFG